MSKDAIARYEEAQLEAVELSKMTFLKRGHLESASDLYPDIDIPREGVAYARGPSPLSLLVLMYEKTIIHVPPYSKDLLEKRYGIALETMLELSEAGVIQPMIGNPNDYQEPHLQQFLNLGAPSVWARGVHALLALGMATSLEPQICPLPVREMADWSVLRARFSSKYPNLSSEELHGRIIADIMVNYADLCVFGHREAVDGLVAYADPAKIAEVLYLLSEVLTYPHLFGFGGTANYDEQSVATDPEFIPLDLDKFITPGVPLKRDQLEFFARSINLKVQSPTLKDILDFHGSGDGRRLREAVASFEAKARALQSFALDVSGPGAMIDASELLRSELLEAARLLSDPGFFRKTASRERYIERTLQVGIIAAGPIVGGYLGGLEAMSLLSGLGGSAILDKFVLPQIKDKITDVAKAALLGPGLANLWRIRKK